ncbi:phage tail tube protein [Agathobaculum sp. Marseille-P7918]|uniref:phage tail tube protein n=1 Tax=Agathobaculum sp. Marseille-P7918 TaxID=2479843 RepID=UPI000F62DC86|nr:phage tail tube protein [Agathobaculum sp. Marseille-P7918]
MPEFDPNKIMHGNGGAAWFNGKKLATLQSVEAKATGDFEPVNVCGDPATYSIYNGYSGEGTLVWLKVDSDVLKLISEAYLSGVMPEITIITAHTQKGTNKVERLAYSNIVVTEIMLAKFEKKTMTEMELPFQFGNFQVLETL